MTRPAPSTHRLRFTSGPGALGRTVRRLRQALVLEVRRPEARALALLAVEEAVANVLEHGYRGQPGRPFTLTFRPLAGERFEVVLRDRAPVVDVARLAPGDLERLAIQKASGGRGLALVRLLVETLEHARRRGGGNVLTLVFDADELSRIAQEHSREAA